MTLGAAFWDDLFGEAESRPLRTGPGYGPLAPPDEHGIRLPDGFRSRIVARGNEPVPGTRLPLAHRLRRHGRVPARGRRVRARLQLGDARGRRIRSPLRARRSCGGRLPDPLRNIPELLRRRDALGDLALVRGGGRRARLGMRPEWAPARGGAPGDGCLQARGRRGRSAGQARLPDRGPREGRPVSLHAERLARPLQGPPRGRALGGAAPSSGSSCPIRSPAARTRAARSPARYSSSAARGSGSTGTRSTSLPRWTTASTPTTPGASASR